MESLQRNIEFTRKRLDEAVGAGCNEQICYEISVELDELIEQYIDAQQKEDLTEKNKE